jgi:hypothetical protein
VKRARWQGPMGPIVESSSSIGLPSLCRPSVIRIAGRTKGGESTAMRPSRAVRTRVSDQVIQCPEEGCRDGGRDRTAVCNSSVNQNSSTLGAAPQEGGAWPSLRRSRPGTGDHYGGHGGERGATRPPAPLRSSMVPGPGRVKCRSRCHRTARTAPKPLESCLVTRLGSFLIYVNSCRPHVRTFNGESRKRERLVMPQKARKIA